MAKKQIRFRSQFFLMGFAFLVSILAPNVLYLIGTILAGGLAGYFLYNGAPKASNPLHGEARLITSGEVQKLGIILAGILILMGALAFLTGQTGASISLATVFSGMSLTLFGGGYVIIPIMEQALVSDLNWVTLSEFNAAIGISQVTPGPILSSVTFIGYKMAGFTGAITATLAIFLPSSVLMLLVSHLHERIKHLATIEAIMTGIRAVVVGLIFSGAYTIGIKSFGADAYSWIIFLLALALSLFTKIHPALVIFIALVISFL